MNEQKNTAIYDTRNNELVKFLFNIKFLRKDSSILDFGSGYGHILRTIRRFQNEIKISSIEPNRDYHPNLLEIGVSKIYENINDIDEEMSFDTVLMIEVIEHLKDPVSAMRGLKSKIIQGASILLTTPAGDTSNHLLPKHKLKTLYDPEHIQYFTEKSLKLCMRKAGFNNLKYKYIPELYPRRRLPKTLAGIYNNAKHMTGFTAHLTYFIS
jgi:2-polyprenyl-3-methyl-5-hydroxy-6-metoxy-1,4-benzoquinol methylase